MIHELNKSELQELCPKVMVVGHMRQCIGGGIPKLQDERKCWNL